MNESETHRQRERERMMENTPRPRGPRVARRVKKVYVLQCKSTLCTFFRRYIVVFFFIFLPPGVTRVFIIFRKHVKVLVQYSYYFAEIPGDGVGDGSHSMQGLTIAREFPARDYAFPEKISARRRGRLARTRHVSEHGRDRHRSPLPYRCGGGGVGNSRPEQAEGHGTHHHHHTSSRSRRIPSILESGASTVGDAPASRARARFLLQSHHHHPGDGAVSNRPRNQRTHTHSTHPSFDEQKWVRRAL